jgi:hypothetical protein
MKWPVLLLALVLAGFLTVQAGTAQKVGDNYARAIFAVS